MTTSLDLLVIASGMSLVIRLVSLIIATNTLKLQLKTFSPKSRLQPVKYALIGANLLVALSNLPIIPLHLFRLRGDVGSPAMTAFATLTNAIAIFIALGTNNYLQRFRVRGLDDDISGQKTDSEPTKK